MKTIWGIFRHDVKRLTASVVTVVVIIGLCLVPSLYAWFNIMSNADPYGPSSTSNIKVAVANEDDGSELVGMKLNIGEMVIEGIAGNDQMGWQFVDTREDALTGVYSGDYYAAIIVPEDFTENFLSLLDGELKHPEVEYYENEKKNAIAPKITNKARTAVQDQINSTLVETVADTINTISDVFRAMGIDADELAEGMTTSIDDACQQMQELTATLVALQTLVDETQNLLDVTTLVVDDAGEVLTDASNVAGGVSGTAGAIYDSASTVNTNLVNTLDQIDKDYASLLDSIANWSGNPTSAATINAYLANAQSCLDSALTNAANGGADIQSDIAAMYSQLNILSGYVGSISDASTRASFISEADSLAANMGNLAGTLDAMAADPAADPTAAANLSAAAQNLRDAQQNVSGASNEVANYSDGSEFYSNTVALLESNDASLNSVLAVAPETMQPLIKLAIENNKLLLAGFVKAGSVTLDQSTIDRINSIRSTLREAVATLNDSINEQLEKSEERVQSALGSVQSSLSSGAQSVSGLSGTLQKYSSAMGDAHLTLDSCIDISTDVNDYLNSVAEDIHNMVNSEAFRQLMDILKNNPDGLADYLSSPVDMRTVIVYEIADYGSSMSPYYIMLALFVGSILTAAMAKPGLAYEEYRLCSPIQHYFGRLLMFLCIGFFQAIVTSLGCLYYVHIQCVDPFLFILACIITSFNFVMMNYSLLFALDNIGLGAAVIIMVIEIAGSGGSYPVHVLPQIYQDLYPYMPFHYGMDMIRETIGGFYGNTYAKCALILLGMSLLFFIMGITLYYPAKKLNAAIAESKKASGIM